MSADILCYYAKAQQVVISWWGKGQWLTTCLFGTTIVTDKKELILRTICFNWNLIVADLETTKQGVKESLGILITDITGSIKIQL